MQGITPTESRREAVTGPHTKYQGGLVEGDNPSTCVSYCSLHASTTTHDVVAQRHRAGRCCNSQGHNANHDGLWSRLYSDAACSFVVAAG